MIYYMRGMDKPYIMAIDIEYDKNKIIQLGSVTLKNIGENLYQPCRSLNVYIKTPDVCQFVQDYTNITQEFLDEYGETKEEAKLKWEQYINDFTFDDVLIVSHGIYQDSLLMKENGFSIDCYEHWCTYNHSKWVLDRDHNLSLSDVLMDSGLLPVNQHNAYADAVSTLNVLSFLLKLEGDQKVWNS